MAGRWASVDAIGQGWPAIGSAGFRLVEVAAQRVDQHGAAGLVY
jgi:hypothetical protein